MPNRRPSFACNGALMTDHAKIGRFQVGLFSGEEMHGSSEQVLYRDWLRSQVDAEEYWFQRIDLGDGLVTPGWSNPAVEKLPYFGLPDDMSGMRVLDIGCSEGFFSFEAERRGASEVVAIDAFPESIRRFNICRSALSSKANAHLASVYDLDPRNFGTFDLIMYFGVLYHLRHPLLSLQKVASVTAGTLLMQTRSFEAPGLRNVPAARFHPFGIQSGPSDSPTVDLSVIWVPNWRCVRDMLLHAGFVNVVHLNPDAPPARTKPRKSTASRVLASRLKTSARVLTGSEKLKKGGARASIAIFRAEAPVRSVGAVPPSPDVSGTDGTFSGAGRF